MNIVELFADLGIRLMAYSGRGMNGDQTLAFVCEQRDLGRKLADVMNHAVVLEDAALRLRVTQWLQHLRWDSMGNESVFYSDWFPMTQSEKEALFLTEE